MSEPSKRLTLLTVVLSFGLVGCVVGPAASASQAPVVSSSPDTADRFADGLPRNVDGDEVLRGHSALAFAQSVSGSSSFLVGGWATFIPGIPVSCPMESGSSKQVWLAPCGQPRLSDVAGDPDTSFVSTGALTFHFADLGGLQSGPVVLRVHVHDPRAAECGTGQSACDRAMVVDRVVWSGDRLTDPHPLSAAGVAAALRSVDTAASLEPLGPGVGIADCGMVLAAARTYAVPPTGGALPAASLVAVESSTDALDRALPLADGPSGALSQQAIEASVLSGPVGASFACRWLKVDNVAVLVRTSSPKPTDADHAFLVRLAAKLSEGS